MEQPTQQPPQCGPPLIINAGLERMGTTSMAEAYRLLGFHTFHALFEDTWTVPWAQFERAAEAKWSGLPGGPKEDAQPPPFTRADWDALFGAYAAVTNLGAYYAADLAAAYPEAKVVVVQRDFDTWWPSIQSVMQPILRPPMRGILSIIAANVFGFRAMQALRKTHYGFYDAQTADEIMDDGGRRARAAYDAYYAEIRRVVPASRRLEYRLGDGWEPLCEFLGVGLPPEGTPFPKVNERAAWQADTEAMRRKFLANMAWALVPWVVGAGAVVIGCRYVLWR